MATIIKRQGKFRVQVSKAGCRLSRTFATKKDAETWGKLKELEIERNDIPTDPRIKLQGVTLGGLVERYISEVTAHKKGSVPETAFLNAFLRHDICKKQVHQVSVSDFAAYRDFRLRTVTPVTLKRQLSTVHNVYTVARDRWGLPLKTNPLDKLAFKAPPVRRDRRLQDGELNLIVADAKLRNPMLLPIVLFAIETGMRKSEMLNMRWRDLHLRGKTLLIPKTKTDNPRRIPLSDRAIAVLEGFDPIKDHCFPVNPQTINVAWIRMIKKLGIEDLHLHDLRHEAISSFFEAGLNIPEVASISGHKDWKMLAIYTQPKPSDILRKLNLGNYIPGETRI